MKTALVLTCCFVAHIVFPAALSAQSVGASSSPALERRAVESAKNSFVVALRQAVIDLEGRYGDEGYRLKQGLNAMERALAEWDDAIDKIAAAAQRVNSADARLVLAEVYFDRHRDDDALLECQRAAALAPLRGSPYSCLGTVHLSQGRPERALEAFQKAAKTDSEDVLSLYQIAQIYVRLGRAADATAALQAFIRAAEKLVHAFWQARALQPPSTLQGPPGAGRRFPIRRAPIDIVARGSGDVAGFLPEMYERAAGQLAAGHYSEALAALRTAVARDPLTRDVPELGSDLEVRLKSAERAVKAELTDSALQIRLGELLLALRRPADARRAFERALELDATLHTPYLRLASLALAEAKIDVAVRHLETASQRRPQSVETLRLLGNAYTAAGETDKAVAQYEAALALEPSERIRTAIAAVVLAARRSEAGEAALKAAVAAHPRSGQAHQNLGRLYQTLGRHEEAADEYRAALALFPIVRRDALYRRVGSISTRQVQLDQTVAAYRAALGIDPHNVPMRLQLGNVLLQANRNLDTIVEHLVVLVFDPLNIAAHTAVAQIELRQGHFAEAVGAARRALEQNRTQMQARYTLGQALLRLGQVAEGKKELAEYARLQSDATNREHRQRELAALQQEAMALVRAEKYEAAIEFLRKAADMEPGGIAESRLGAALVKVGRNEEAIERLEKAINLRANSEMVHFTLSEAYKALGRVTESERHRVIYERMREDRLKRIAR